MTQEITASARQVSDERIFRTERPPERSGKQSAAILKAARAVVFSKLWICQSLQAGYAPEYSLKRSSSGTLCHPVCPFTLGKVFLPMTAAAASVPPAETEWSSHLELSLIYESLQHLQAQASAGGELLEDS